MNYRCLSCRAKYAIPDARVAAAGADGLRVRCSRCRAIMAVTAPMTSSIDLPMRGEASTMPMSTGVFQNPFAQVALPSSLGVGGGEAGSREVTGVFLPLLSSVEAPKEGSAHFWAAVGGRPRGPFTSKELIVLADKGKVRAGTLVWRPGTSGWQPLKDVTEFDVSWLRDAVVRRKQREQQAEQDAFARRGIQPIRIERHTVRGMPPIPAAWDIALDDAPSALPQLVGGELTGSFEWRAPLVPRPPVQRSGGGDAVVGLAVVTFVASAVVMALLAWR